MELPLTLLFLYVFLCQWLIWRRISLLGDAVKTLAEIVGFEPDSEPEKGE